MAGMYVEIDLESFSDEEILEEFESRGLDSDYKKILRLEVENEAPNEFKKALINLYECKRYEPEKFDEIFSQFIYEYLGKNV